MEMASITEEQARRLIKWAIENGHTEEQAYEAVITVLNAKVPKEKEGSTEPNKQ